MKFPDVTKTTFEKNECSPHSESTQEETLLLVNVPNSITWGAPLPACGFVKASEYMDVTIRMDHKKMNLIPGVIDSSTDLVPRLSTFESAFKKFKVDGSIYFNTNLLSADRNPPPGLYEIELQTYDGKARVQKNIEIKPEGEKYEFIKILANQICKKEMLKKYKKFFEAKQAAEVCGDPLPGHATKQPDIIQIQQEISKQWQNVWPLFADDFSRFSNEKLIAWSQHFEIAPNVFVLNFLLEKQCVQQKKDSFFDSNLRFILESFVHLKKTP